MNAKEAVAARILELCNERGIAIRIPAWFPCRSSVMGWELPFGNFSMMISSTTLSRRLNKQQERRFFQIPALLISMVRMKITIQTRLLR